MMCRFESCSGHKAIRPDGEIGRHASLRGWCRLRCASSSLVLGTKNIGTCHGISLFLFVPLLLRCRLSNRKSPAKFPFLYSDPTEDCCFASDKPCLKGKHSLFHNTGSIHTNVPVYPECPKLSGVALFAGYASA